MRIVTAFLTIVLAGATALAQESVPPPPQPAEEAQANIEVLKLLRAGVSERAILHVISDAASKFDTSADALAMLKQAGASEAELSAILAKSTTRTYAPVAGAQTNSGPSLAETTQFIQDKLDDIGKVAFVALFQNTSNGRTSTSPYTIETRNIVADPGQCRISYYQKETLEGITTWDRRREFSLRDVKKIVVMPFEQEINEFQAQIGSLDRATSTSPAIILLIVRLPHEGQIFYFSNAELADRVAKAMIHIVELCGGGSAPEPF